MLQPWMAAHKSAIRPEIHFVDKFGPKNQNWQFKLKFGTKTNSNMQKIP